VDRLQLPQDDGICSISQTREIIKIIVEDSVVLFSDAFVNWIAGGLSLVQNATTTLGKAE
jgi:hypothetical protein